MAGSEPAMRKHASALQEGALAGEMLKRREAKNVNMWD